jgi:hypothetical protein
MNEEHQPNLGWLKLIVDVRAGKYCFVIPLGIAFWVLACLAIVLLVK